MMLEFITNHIPCAAAFISNPVYLGLTIASAAAAVMLFNLFKREATSLKRKVLFAYAHLFLLVLPAMLFLYTMACTAAPTLCDKSDMGWLNAVGIILPATFAVSLAAGLVAIPLLFAFSAKGRRYHGSEAKWIETAAKSLGVRAPRVYLIDDSKPQAFSFSSIIPSIFISLGALELFSKKEREAVLLHELGHIKSGSSSLKFSALILKLATPLSAQAFHQALTEEERKADGFAARAQGTRRHLESARRKVEAFE